MALKSPVMRPLKPGSPGVRWRLVVFAIGCMAVAVSLAGIAAFFQARRELIQTEAQVRRDVHDRAQQAEQQFAIAAAILSALSTSPVLQQDDFSAFYRQASAVQAPQGSWFILVRPGYRSRADQLVNTGRPLGAPPQSEPATEATIDMVKRIVATRDVQISDLVYTPVTNGYVLGVGTPVFRNGEVAYVLVMVLRQVTVTPDFESSSSGFSGVVDRSGQLLPGHNLPDPTTRRPPFDPALLKAGSSEGVLDGATADGTPLYIAYSRSGLTGWTAFHGIPRAELDAPRNGALLIVGIGMVLLPITGAGIALLAGPGVILPLRRLIEEEEERLQVIADTVPSMLFTADRTGACDYISERFCEYTGLPLSAAERFGWIEVLHPDDKTKILEEMRNRQQSGTPRDVELRLRDKGGTYRWFAIRTSQIKGADGKVFGTATEIDALKRAERMLGDLSRQLIKVQDDERRRIAREIHDTTVQNLVAAKMQIEHLHDGVASLGATSAQAIEEAEKLLRQSLSELRTLSYLLHPPMLDELGLAAAVRWYAQGFQKRSGIAVSVETPVLPRLPPDAEMALFRVVQEGLGNVHRHSGSPEARITFVCHPDQIELQIADSGHGIPTTVRQQGNYGLGVGIPGMRLRVQQLGGTLEFESGRYGSTLSVAVPFAKPSTKTTSAGSA